MDKKEKYREFCDQERSIPLFSRAWWLDAVCGEDNWNVCLVQKGNEIWAAMPYYHYKKLGISRIVQPQLTQTLGPWIRHSGAKYSKALAWEKDLMEALINQLPSYHYFSQRWHYSRTNWLPFYWKGFSQTTRYTYVIEDLSDLERVYSNFEHSKRKNINKAREVVRVVFHIPAEEFYQNHQMTLASQGENISYSECLFNRLYRAAYERNCGVTIGAYDLNENMHAALFIVWDEESAYDLISTIDPQFRTFGAASLLVKEAIAHVATQTKKFDFEGSMIEGVERSFRQFGAKQLPYFQVKRTPSRILRTLKFLRDLRFK